MTEKFEFISPYLKWHGTGYLDVILQSFEDAYEKGASSEDNLYKLRDAYEMHEKFFGREELTGKLKHIKRVVYLLPKGYQQDLKQHSRWKEFLSEEKQEAIRNSIKKTAISNTESIGDLDKLCKYLRTNKCFPDYQWLKENWATTVDLWHIINAFSIKTQVDWYKANSKIYQNHSTLFEFIELEATFDQFEAEEFETTNALNKWLVTQHGFDKNTYFNLWGTQTTCQLALHYLAWSTPSLNITNFVKCRSVSANKDHIPSLKLELTRKELLADLTRHQLSENLSPSQQEVVKWLEAYKSWGDLFTILLLGPRGCGKTMSVNQVFADKGVVFVNCAQFQSNPELACSALFGHKKGAFTGATQDKIGAFELAHNKVLFLDEVHHLDSSTQAMLLTALQTDKDGFFSFMPLGGKNPQQARFQLVVASNLQYEELLQKLPTDLLDRISQRILEFEGIEPGESVLEKFNHVWKDMNFRGKTKPQNPLPFNEPFRKWLVSKERRFFGNYRDLQAIAILCADYERGMDAELITKGLSLLDHIKQHTEKFLRRESSDSQAISIEAFLDKHGDLSLTEMTNEFKAKVVRAAELHCGDLVSVSQMLGVSRKALIDIKNRYDG